MARVTVEDCLKRIPNRFFLVHATAKRVRQLREGSERLIDAPDNEDIVAALREIAAGKVFVTRHYADYEEPSEELEETALKAETAKTPDDKNDK
jgi:DNA-directed RNA polymerase subunit omega